MGKLNTFFGLAGAIVVFVAIVVVSSGAVRIARGYSLVSTPAETQARLIPPLTPEEESVRREKVLADIIAEYPKRDDGCPSNHPLDWINAKLKERGEEWQMIPRAQTSIVAYNTFMGPCNDIDFEAQSGAAVENNTLFGPHNNVHVRSPNSIVNGNVLQNNPFIPAPPPPPSPTVNPKP
jgi:hypothetical protein